MCTIRLFRGISSLTHVSNPGKSPLSAGSESYLFAQLTMAEVNSTSKMLTKSMPCQCFEPKAAVSFISVNQGQSIRFIGPINSHYPVPYLNSLKKSLLGTLTSWYNIVNNKQRQ
jgi:hypothetical protein